MNLFVIFVVYGMKVRLIKKQTIEDYATANAQSRVPFGNWLSIIKHADWNVPTDILQTFASADRLADTNRIVFNIGGNNYRMICKCQFGRTMVHLTIKWIGTHSEYDRLCAANEQYTVNAY